MKREIFQTQNIYPRTVLNPQASYIVNQPEISFHFREQKSPQHHPRPFPIPPPDRFSQEVSPNTQPNNAFLHLRNEISNLRTEFSKLIQKDNIKGLQRPMVESREKDVSAPKRDSRMPTYSTIGFYHKTSELDKKPKPIQTKPKYDQYGRTVIHQTPQHKSYIFEKNETEITCQQSKLDEKNKYLAKSYFEHSEALIPSPETTKIQDLQKEIIRINENRHKAEQEATLLRNELNTKQEQFKRQLRQKAAEIDTLKQTIDQDKISLSLKNSLVEKLEREIAKLQNEISYLHKQNQYHDQQLRKQKEKYESHLSLAEEIHRINVAEIIQKYQETQESLQRTKLELITSNQIIAEKDKALLQTQQNHRASTNEVAALQLQLEHQKKMREALEREASQKITELKSKPHFQQPKESTVTPQTLAKIKHYEEENIDLKKRVESYKKSIEQLNSTNNSSREKLAKAKEQVKVLAEQCKIKEALINSLYRDISILDNEMRQIPILKGVIATHNKFIQDLNQNIMHLQCSNLSRKYKEKLQD